MYRILNCKKPNITPHKRSGWQSWIKIVFLGEKYIDFHIISLKTQGYSGCSIELHIEY